MKNISIVLSSLGQEGRTSIKTCQGIPSFSSKANCNLISPLGPLQKSLSLTNSTFTWRCLCCCKEDAELAQGGVRLVLTYPSWWCSWQQHSHWCFHLHQTHQIHVSSQHRVQISPLCQEIIALGSIVSIVLIAPSQLNSLVLNGAMVLSPTFVGIQEK